MRRVLAMTCCGVALGLVGADTARADGGPVLPVEGGVGVGVRGSAVRYAAIGVRRTTIVARVRRGSGAIERWRAIRGLYGVAAAAYDGSNTGLSADGRTLVLAGTTRRSPLRRTRLVVLDARRLRVRARITLPGLSTVDALSPTGRWLYLIRYASARNPQRYEVRAYDLRARRLLPRPVVDPREPDEAMLGVPITRTMSPDGRWAYTLYQRPPGELFVHALDTERRTAACVDLPALRRGDPADMRLVLTGATLRVQNSAGPHALIDTRTFAVSTPPAARWHAPRWAAPDAPARDEGAGLPWGPAAIGALLLAALGAVGRRRRGVS